ncbi:MAG TPA: pitrilysin family protein [Polyangiaceae bacterium]
MAAAATLVLLAACGGEGATQPPAMAPPPPPPSTPTAVAPAADTPPVTDGDVTTATVAGIQVLVQKMPGAAFAAGRLIIRGGTRNWTAANAGIEQLALSVASSGGTRSLDKTAFSRRLAALGASIGADPRNDFSALAVKAPRAAWDDAFALLADVFENPALPASEVDLVRTQMLAGLHHEQEDPDGQVWTLLRKQIFAGHPYANRPTGTLESVGAIQAQDLGPYLDKLRETGRLVFIASGDLDASHVIDQVRAAYGSLPHGSYVESPIPPLVFDAPHFLTKERKLPTNYCETVFPAPAWTDPDWAAGLVAISAYSYRLWDEVRTKRNLTYAVNAYINQSFMHPFGMMSVSAVDANTAMRVMLEEARKLRDQPIADDDLAGFKSEFLTGYLREHETPDYQAWALGDALLYGGDWHFARTLPDRVRAVTAGDIQAFAKKYFGHLQAAVVGDPSKVDGTLFTSL